LPAIIRSYRKFEQRIILEAIDEQLAAIMMVIDLAKNHPTLEDVIGLAKDKVVVLRQPHGSAFAISQLGDFEIEVELLRNSPDFLSFRRQLSREDATISLEDLRKELALEA
jgi:hypothetical protein